MDEHSPPKAKVKRKTPKKLSEGYLRNSALYYLQRHPTSVAHFIEVMGRKIKRSTRVYPEQDADAFLKYVEEHLVAEFARAGFLNDALYAKALTTSLQRRGLPKRAITMRLASKGVEPDEETLAEQNDLAAACRFAKRKRLGAFAKVERDPQKDLAALARAGFGYDVASRVLRATLAEIEEGLD